MNYQIAITLGDKIVELIEINNAQSVQVDANVYYFRNADKKCIFSVPLEKVAYVKSI